MEELQQFLKGYDVYLGYFPTKDPEGRQRAEIFSNQELQISLCWYDSYENFLSENFKNLVTGNINIYGEGDVIRPTVILCNEIFDALPISIFEYTKYGWCEK